jgi:hypothetical protein
LRPYLKKKKKPFTEKRKRVDGVTEGVGPEFKPQYCKKKKKKKGTGSVVQAVERALQKKKK